MFPNRDAFDSDSCPVGDDLLGELYRANENGLPALVESVSSDVRAMLALFCYKPQPSAFAGARDRLDLQRARAFAVRRPRRLRALRAVPQSKATREVRPPAAASRSRCRPSRCRRSCRSTMTSTISSRSRLDLICSVRAAPAARIFAAPSRIRHRRACRCGRPPAAAHRSRKRWRSPTLPCKAQQRSFSQRMPDSRSLTSAGGIRSSAASSSIVKRGQLAE